MKIFQSFIIFIVIISQVFAIHSKNEPLLKSALLEITNLSSGPIEQNLQDIARNAYVANQLLKESDPIKPDLCKKIQSATQSKGVSSKTAYYLALIKPICDSKLNEKQLVQEAKDQLTSNQLDNVYYSIKLLSVLDPQAEISSGCKKLSDFIQSDGSSRSDAKQQDSSSYQNTASVLELYAICIQNLKKSEGEKLIKDLQLPFESALINSFQFARGQYAFLEKQYTLETTARIVASFEQIHKNNSSFGNEFFQQYRNQQFAQFINYVLDNRDAILNSRERLAILNLLKATSHIPFVFTKLSPVVVTKSQGEVQFTLENLLGQKTNFDLSKISASLHYQGKEVAKDLKVSKNSRDNNGQYEYVIQIESSKIKSFGQYELEFVLQGSEGYSKVEIVNFVTKVSLPSIEFEVAQEKRVPQKFSHKAKFAEVSNSVQKANQNSFLYFRFQLEFENSKAIDPSQVALRLNHPKFPSVTNLVNAEKKNKDHDYIAIIDLGDPKTILPYNGTYECQLLIGDQRLKESISWTFAKFEITFKRGLKDTPPSDADYVLAPEIQHTFPPERKDPPKFFVFTFLVFMALSFLVFITILKKIKVNFGKITALGSLSAFLFVAFIIIMFGVLLLFWVKINLFDTLKILAVLVIPFFLVGNFALTQLKGEETENKKLKVD